jgi:protein TonB
MYSASLVPSSNMRAMAGSIAFHALIGVWFLSSVVPVEIMPQQMIKVTMIAAPSAEPVEQKHTPTPQPPPPEKVQKHEVKKPKESPRAMQQIKPPPPAQATLAEQLAALAPAAGKTANTTETAQLVMTKPLFDAEYLNNPAPEYPAQAKRRNMEGTVMLDVAVSAAGTAQHVRIAESSGFALLDESARHTVSRWKFVPAKHGGEIVEARVMIPIEFRLE